MHQIDSGHSFRAHFEYWVMRIASKHKQNQWKLMQINEIKHFCWFCRISIWNFVVIFFLCDKMLENKNFSGIMFSIQFDVAIRKRNTPNWFWTHFSCSFPVVYNGQNGQIHQHRSERHYWLGYAWILSTIRLEILDFSLLSLSSRARNFSWNWN